MFIKPKRFAKFETSLDCRIFHNKSVQIDFIKTKVEASAWDTVRN